MQKSNLRERYRSRRNVLLSRMSTGVALITQAPSGTDPFLFDKNLEYLIGKHAPDTVLLLAPKGIYIKLWETQATKEVGRGILVNEVLFVRAATAREKAIDGKDSATEQIRQDTGVENVLWVEELDSILGFTLMQEDTLWVNIAAPSCLGAPLCPQLVKIKQIKERYPWVNVKNAAMLIHDMRRVKDDYEIACLRRAFELHTEIFEQIMSTLKPNDNEAKGKAIWDYQTLMYGDEISGNTLDRYASNIVVGAGKNTALAHYMDNNRDIADGDLVLIDTGLSVNGYSSDITRVFPANGHFSPRQRELYSIVLEAQQAAIATMKPGSTAAIAHRAVFDVWKKYGLEKYGYGTCGHPVGLNIHDANGRKSDDDLPFEPGVVLAIEPFLFIPHEGIGIRIEDGILITQNGCELLAGPPRDIEGIERLCCRE